MLSRILNFREQRGADARLARRSSSAGEMSPLWNFLVPLLIIYTVVAGMARGKVCRGLAGFGGAQALREGLQELPSEGAVFFDERAELPEGEAVTNEIGCSGNGGGARAAVDQGDFA